MSKLSSSNIWDKMNKYYSSVGPDAWKEEVVPSHISSNKFIATAYANILLGHILDYFNINKNMESNKIEPFYILEIGAGHGKLSFYILKLLLPMLKDHNLPENCIKYILTDISNKNIESIKTHNSFQTFISTGVLDVALFNALEDKEINLFYSKSKISKHSLKKPLFMICNYIFDTLSHDAFQIKNNKLYEARLVIDGNHQNLDIDHKKSFENTEYHFDYTEISTDYFGNKKLDKILKDYLDFFDEASFLIPTGSFTCIENVKEFTKDHLTILVADKATANLELFSGLESPDITFHGSVSLTVNFDSINKYFINNNGFCLNMDSTGIDFQVGCYSFADLKHYPLTRHFYNQSIAEFSPYDLFSFCYIGDEISENMQNRDQLLALMNLSKWDPNIFYDFHDQFLEDIDNISVDEEQTLLSGLEKVIDFFFLLELNQDIPFAVGRIYYSLDLYEKAIDMFDWSLTQFPPQAEVYYNVALCYNELEKYDNCYENLQKSLTIDPEYKEAKKMLRNLKKCLIK